MAVSKGFELASLGSGLDTSQSDGEVLVINMDTDVVSEGTTNLYFTNERVDDRVNSLLVAGASVSLTYDDSANTLTIALDTSGGIDLSNNSTADLPEDPAATVSSGTMYYSDARVQTYLSGGTATTIETTGNVIIGGNLTVSGTSSTINSTELTVDDLNITIASGAADAAAANGAGITVDGANATILYDGTNDYWVLNKEPYYSTLRLLTTDDLTGSDNYAFKTITDGSNNSVADSNVDTFTFSTTDQIEATIDAASDTLTIGHADSGVTAASYGSSTAVPVITIDAQGHITAASTSTITTSWTVTDGVTSQQIAGGDTLTVVDGTDINAVVGATDTLTINNTSTLQTVTGRGNTTTSSVGIGTNTVTSGHKLDIFGTTLAQDAVYVQDDSFSVAYNSVTGLVIDSSHINGGSAGYGNSISFSKRSPSIHKKAAIALYQAGSDPDAASLRFFVSQGNTATDPVSLALELLSGAQVKISDSYTLPTSDGTSNQALITDGSGTLSFGSVNNTINWNVTDNYAFKTVVAGGTNLVADSNTDTLTISTAQVASTDGIVITGDAGTDTLTISHADTSSVINLTTTANTFVTAQTYDTYGHVLTRSTGTIDWDVSSNYAYKFMSDGTNTSTAASNTDTFTFSNGTDTTAVVDGPNDSVVFNNTSTLDSVTGRGNTTTNNITVNDATVNGNLTVNGTLTTLDTNNLTVEDAVIVLNKNQSTPANDIGFVFQRYNTASSSNYNVAMAWNETDDRLFFGETTENGTDNTITASSEWMTITNNGRVGIGRTNPQTTLDISGNISLHDGGTGDRNIEIGRGRTDSGNSYLDLITDTTYTDYGARFIRNSGENASTELVTRGTGTLAIITRDAGPIAFYTNNTLRASISSTGKVGIGTGLSSTMLHLYANNDGGAANNTLRFEDSDAGTAANQQLGLIEFYGNDTSTGGTGQKAYMGAFAESLTPDVYLAFGTDAITGTASERMRITSTGNVGIGTNNPTELLHVEGSSISPVSGLIRNLSSGQASIDLKNSEGEFRIITDDGRYYIYDQTDAIIRFDINTLGAITFNNAYTFPTADGTTGQALITDGAGNLSFGSLSDSIDWNVANNYAFTTISTPAGTNPVADSNTDTLTLSNGADISIVGDSAGDSITIANTSTLQTVTSRGNSTTSNVGIGTNDTSSTLVVDGSVDTNTDWYTNAQSTIRLKNSNSNGAPVLKFENTLGRVVYGSGSASDKLIFTSRESQASTTEVVTLDNNSQVGIGTVGPTERLHVRGGAIAIDAAGSGNTASLKFINDNERSRITSNYDSGGGGRLGFWTDTTGGSLAQRMTINNAGNVGIGTILPVNNSNRTTLGLQGVWGGQLDIMVGSTVHAQFGTDNFSTGQSARIQSQDGIVFKTNGSNERMRIDSSGRVGIGGIPNTNWRTDIANQEVLMLGGEATFFSDAGVTTELWNNAYVDNSDTFKNISTRGASRYFQYQGAHKWYTAASATAGSTINTELNTTPKMILDVSGNVGIGTVSPTEKLHVSGNIKIQGTNKLNLNTNGSLYWTNTGNIQGVLLTNGSTEDINIKTNQAADIVFWTSGENRRMTITADGNVGIGTADPSSELEVQGTITSRTTNNISNIIMSDDGAGNESATTSRDAMIVSIPRDPTQKPVSVIHGRFEASANKINIGGMSTHSSGNWDGTGVQGATEINFYTTSAVNTETFSSTNPSMSINNNGNVGIGTNSPSGRLHVSDVSDFYVDLDGTDSAIVFKEGGGNSWRIGNRATGDKFNITQDSTSLGIDIRFTIDDGGNVGIGTDSPDAKLDVNGAIASGPGTQALNGDANLTLREGDAFAGLDFKSARTAGNIGGPRFYNTSSTSVPAAQFLVEVDGSYNFYNGTNGAEKRLKIDSAGNVGIGTDAPQETLHVNGSVRIDSTYNLDSATSTLNTTTQTSILAISATTFGSAKYLIQAYDSVSGERQVSELLLISDGTTVTSTEYAILFTGSAPLADFNTDISGGNIRLLATNASSNSTEYKVKLTAILA